MDFLHFSPGRTLAAVGGDLMSAMSKDRKFRIESDELRFIGRPGHRGIMRTLRPMLVSRS